jgi:hypothetical protein
MPRCIVRCSTAGSIREELRAVENRTVAIRKLLRRLKGRLPRGVTGDAEKLTRTIESLARFGQHCSAADAVEVGSMVDVLASLLGVELDGFLAL